MTDSSWKEEVAQLVKEIRLAVRAIRLSSKDDDETKPATLKSEPGPDDSAAEHEFRLKLARIGLIKTAVTLLLGSFLAAVLGYVIQQQLVGIKKAESFQQVQQDEEENLRDYFEYTMIGDAHSRLKLSLYFSTVLSDEQSRERWAEYHRRVEQILEDSEKTNRDLQALRDQGIESGAEFAALRDKAERLKKLVSPVDEVREAVAQRTQADFSSCGWPAAVPPESGYWPVAIAPDQVPDYHSGGRNFCARRSGGKRRHAGVDLVVPPGTAVIAPESGVVIRGPYYFYSDTYALEFKTDRGLVLRLGQLHKQGPENVQVGKRIEAGEVIGFVGRLRAGSSQLHIEVYAGNLDGRLTVAGDNFFKRRNDILDPTSYLDALAATGKITSAPPLDSTDIPLAEAEADTIAVDAASLPTPDRSLPSPVSPIIPPKLDER